ncbi:hypothetical protein B4099_2965 [Heyndrickxia coagulans]|uniref:Uncharacterized protein n=1 Tax=Heyndrickxia coagulans TaxID=1398 RepID=A0A150KFX7_HEYCO|nr:hypothetical protein B4099_2965 [Heyndrickxia coagulans]
MPGHARAAQAVPGKQTSLHSAERGRVLPAENRRHISWRHPFDPLSVWLLRSILQYAGQTETSGMQKKFLSARKRHKNFHLHTGACGNWHFSRMSIIITRRSAA